MGVTISAPDALRQSVEAATGGVNTVLYDSKGYPSVMCVVPRFNIEDIHPDLGTGTHPAFLVGGVQKSEIFVGKYLARIHDSHALSLPGQDPSASINFDTADLRCTAKGPGWHMMTNAEWSAVALWCWKNGFMPRGNTNYGRDHAQTADGKFARDHDEHDPGRHPTPADEDHHAGRHQQLIGQRVEEFAEIADLIVVAGNIAVQKIGNAGDHKDRNSGPAQPVRAVR